MSTPRKVKSIKDYAFNVQLVAYDHGLGDLPTTARRLGFKEIRRNAKLADFKTHELVAPSTKPTNTELSIDQSELVGIWVGMRPAAAPNHSSRGAGDNTIKGNSVSTLPAAGGLKILEEDEEALRIVAPMNRETASYYALVGQDADGVCSAISVDISEVFFFPDFRTDSTTAIQKRKAEWGALVRKACNPVDKITFAKDYDKTKFEVEPRRGLINELSSLVSTYNFGGDKSLLKSAAQLIQENDTLGVFTPPPRNASLGKLRNLSAVMTDEECISALAELYVSAPELIELKITSEDLQIMSTAIVGAKIALPYHHTRAFIASFHTTLQNEDEGPLSKARLAKLAIECAKFAHLVVGGKPDFVERDFENDTLRTIFDGQKMKLQDVNRYIQTAVRALKNCQGDNAVATAPTLPQIWEKYGLSPDVDSAKLYGTAVHQHNVQALSKILMPVEEMLEENCKLLEELSASLPTTDETT